MFKNLWFISALLLLMLFAHNAIGQSTEQIEELNKLDETAFISMESNSPEAIEIANELLKLSSEANSPIHQINAYTILGIINKNKAHYVTSVDYYNQALEVAEDIEDYGRASACYNNIGSVYQIQENYIKALSFYKKSLEIEENLQNPLQISIRYYNIGETYREMDSLTLALLNFNNSLIIEKQHNNNEGIVYSLLGIADVYLELDRNTDASISLEEAKSHIDQSDAETRILYNLLKAEILHKEESFDDALTVLHESITLSEEFDFRIYLMEIYEKESEIKKAQEQSTSLKLEQHSGSQTYLLWISLFVLGIGILVFGRMFIRSKRKKTSDTQPNREEIQNIGNDPIFEIENNRGKSLIKTPLKDIISFEASDNYVTVYFISTNGELQKTMLRISMKLILSELEKLNSSFLRVHKSHIVNPEQIEAISGKSQAYKLKMQHSDLLVPVSRSFDIQQIQL